VEVVTASAERVTWSWETHKKQMEALLSGLGMVAVVIAVTFKCIPLCRVTEISYLTSIKDILETWGVIYRTSEAQQISWYPFTELVILTHTNALDKNSWSCKQSWVSQKLGLCSEYVARAARKINILLSSSLPLFSSLLARIQFFSMWSVARYRSDPLEIAGEGPGRPRPSSFIWVCAGQCVVSSSPGLFCVKGEFGRRKFGRILIQGEVSVEGFNF